VKTESATVSGKQCYVGLHVGYYRFWLQWTAVGNELVKRDIEARDQDETDTFQHSVSRPLRDPDFEIETLCLVICLQKFNMTYLYIGVFFGPFRTIHTRNKYIHLYSAKW